jgi:Protein of unknown function (DUF732)
MGRTRVLRGMMVVLAAAVAGGCGTGSSSGNQAADQSFLSEVLNAAPNINSVRSNTQLIRLGHAVCDDFRAKASYEQVADRLSIEAGSDTLPPEDLGAVITAAADNYCPQFRDLVS